MTTLYRVTREYVPADIESHTLNTADAVAEFITDAVTEDDFRDYLDNTFSAVDINYVTYYPAEILEKCDPIRWRCDYIDFKSDIFDEIADDARHMQPGATLYYYGFEIEAIEGRD